MGEVESPEVEISYNDGERRVLRGVIIDEDDEKIVVKRRDGIVKIYKRCLVCINEPTPKPSEDGTVNG